MTVYNCHIRPRRVSDLLPVLEEPLDEDAPTVLIVLDEPTQVRRTAPLAVVRTPAPPISPRRSAPPTLPPPLRTRSAPAPLPFVGKPPRRCNDDDITLRLPIVR